MAVQWPPTSTNHAGYPGFNCEVTYLGPEVLVEEYADGSEDIRVKSAKRRRGMRFNYFMNGADTKAAIIRAKLYGLSNSFTIYSPAADDKGTAILVRWRQLPIVTQVEADWYRLDCQVVETEAI